MTFGGAKPVSSVSACAPTACPDSLRPRSASEISARHSAGSAQCTGSGAIIPATWLPSVPVPRWFSRRTLTGTNALSSRPLTSSPRRSRWRRSAPVTTVRTTSLTVPPSAFLIALTSPSEARSHVKRRSGPTTSAL